MDGKFKERKLEEQSEIYAVLKQWPQKTYINYKRKNISFTVEITLYPDV